MKPAFVALPLGLATQAHSGTSFVPEKRGQSEVKAFADMLASYWENLSKRCQSDDELAKLAIEFDRFQNGLLAHYKAVLVAKSRIVSVMIAGGSNFPVERMRKRNNTEHNRVTDFLEYKERALRAISRAMWPECHGVKTADPKALELLQKKMDKAVADQERMKLINKAHAKYVKKPESLDENIELSQAEKDFIKKYQPRYSWEPHPYPPYAMTNNGAEIRRLKKRIEEVTAYQKLEHKEEERDGVKVIENVELGRIQLVFPGKPSEDVRTKLKRNGFRWSPSEGAWQRHLNSAWRYAVNEVMKAISV